MTAASVSALITIRRGIRTYNYPQGRVTDHRIGLTLHRLDAVLNGDLDEILDALITAQQSKLLQQVK